ncbi:MAG: UvrD-helicase domain-containing protein [Gemmatimonadota bacterium]
MTFPSPIQRQAIAGDLGPTLVLAGPGAGKTSCLVGRIDHLIRARGFDPARLCAVTFTNKAAEEIVHRLKTTLGRVGEEVTRGTIHSLCLDILRRHTAEVGLQAGFGVADDAYQHAALGRLRVPRKYRGSTLNLFGRHRIQGYELTPQDQRRFLHYQTMLHAANMADFDDLVVRTADLFRNRPDIADEVASRWDYILIDECQDLNILQYQILSRLAVHHRNIFAVGDDEQSIFSWASADPMVLTQFSVDFGVRPIVLDENCRCSEKIFDAARRLIRQNPELFKKDLRARRQSEYAVESYAFADEEGEAEWIVADLLATRARSGLSWGDLGILYRRHESGERLETRLLAAGIPCRPSRGRAISDDKVIAQALASLRVMLAPDDVVAVEALAELVLPPLLLDHIRNHHGNSDLLAGLRVYALEHRGQPDARKAWRFIYAVENLKAIRRAHETLTGLVDAILSQGAGAYRNPLEAESEKLSDPADYPGAVELAAALDRASRSNGRLWITPSRGLEIALRGMLLKAGFSLTTIGSPPETMPVDDLVLDARAEPGIALRLFKALQINESRGWEDNQRDFVAFDLETTDNNIDECEIIEVGAVRVRNGAVVGEFQSLVHCHRTISPKATEVHGYRDADLTGAPEFAAVWPLFRAFVGDDTLVAHNGQQFDVPVLRRMAGGMAGVRDLVFYDSLPLARSLFTQSARLTDLAARFGVEAGRSHHALDDAAALALVYGHLNRARRLRARKAALVDLVDYLGLALALENRESEPEATVILEIARYYTLGRFGESLEDFVKSRAQDDTTTEEVIARLGGNALMERLRETRTSKERYPSAVARLRALVEASESTDVDEAIRTLLDRIALSKSDGAEVDRDRVNLLTLHATKGLEFGQVYLVGVEDGEMPGQKALANNRLNEIEEARRLLYVGMTRAKDRLVLTRAHERRGQPAGNSQFLEEIGLRPIEMAPASV